MSERTRGTAGGGYSFLVVDDEEPIRRYIGRVLSSQGFAVTMAEDGPTALDLYRAHRPDIVVSDIRMPGLDGIALTEEIRCLDPEAEIILITGYADTDMVILALRKGASNFLAKPFQLQHLLVQLEPSLLRVGLRKENEQLRIEIDALQRKRERAQRIETMTRLLAGLSKEIHVPLDLVSHNANLAQEMLAAALGGEGLQGDDLREVLGLLEEVQSCTQRVQGIVRDINQFLAPSDRDVTEGVSLASAVRCSIEAAESHRPSRASLDVALPDEEIEVLCSPEDLIGTLTRVLQNSYEALESQGSRVRLSATVRPAAEGEAGGAVEITVEDDGVGIAGEDLDEVFVPFVSRRQWGVGLGLSLALEATRRNGGQMEIVPVASGGTRVVLQFPRGILAGAPEE